MTLEEQFGAIDIYLFDQALRGRITPRDRVLDAGCGFGRNLVYLMRIGCDVHGVDSDAESIGAVRAMARALAPSLSPEQFRVEPIEAMTVPDGFATVVISSAVLHFARDEAHFDAMLTASWRALAPGGMFFCRLASRIGQSDATPVGHGRYRLPDGTTRFLVDETMLLGRTARLGGQLLDPLKTTIVHGQRSMTTWVARKNGSGRGV
jgi:tellurite methyltransferase